MQTLRAVMGCAVLAAAAQLAGCASIVSGTNQSVSVETHAADGAPLVGANCKLMNNKGTWYVTSPGSAVVNRSFEDLSILCEKDKHPSGWASVKSSTKPMAFGNILFGGVIGAGVDIGTGAAYDYPALIKVKMGAGPVGTAPLAAAPRVEGKPD